MAKKAAQTAKSELGEFQQGVIPTGFAALDQCGPQ
jgi:hypothetical protein